MSCHWKARKNQTGATLSALIPVRLKEKQTKNNILQTSFCLIGEPGPRGHFLTLNLFATHLWAQSSPDGLSLSRTGGPGWGLERWVRSPARGARALEGQECPPATWGWGAAGRPSNPLDHEWRRKRNSWLQAEAKTTLSEDKTLC